MSTPRPSELEIQVLSVLWDKGPSTARSVLAALPDRKPRAYTTVLSVLQQMEKKGLLTHTATGNTYIYKPAVAPRQVIRPMMRDMLRHVFGGSPVAALQSLLDAKSVNADELKAIQQLVDQAAKEARKEGK